MYCPASQVEGIIPLNKLPSDNNLRINVTSSCRFLLRAGNIYNAPPSQWPFRIVSASSSTATLTKPLNGHWQIGRKFASGLEFRPIGELSNAFSLVQNFCSGYGRLPCSKPPGHSNKLLLSLFPVRNCHIHQQLKTLPMVIKFQMC